ncbi:APC family permease, partial [Nocardioides sp.]|uniref:APC family permease n=1 Tax=Nocardioides sp. TaxID=35761 RepID=UPI003566FD26
MTSADPARTSRTPAENQLRRTLSLRLLVLYGLGVTVGAGIFALVGEILGSAGDQAPVAFLVAGVIAGLTAISYMALVGQFPRAGGEAVYVRNGLGTRAGRLAGGGVVVTGVISSAVVALAFAGYVATLIPVPEPAAAVGVVALLCAVAWWGVKQSVVLAALVTVLEVGTILVVIGFGIPSVQVDAIAPSFNLFADGAIGP